MQPTLKQPGLLFMDMDSTLIQCECIDEIASFLGIKGRIAAITRRAMEGEIDFSTSLVERVALLKGLDASVLQQVYSERITITDGARHLISTLHDHSWRVGLVSGGFTYFTDRLQQELALDFSAANLLEIVDGKLTGSILGAIVDGAAKRELLLRQAALWNIPRNQTVAIGDGANDLPMLSAAAVGIAFHAKDAVRQRADATIDSGGLDQALKLLAS
ncbi:MAG: phosphoserine phosphatase SerB [Mariprofundales bacterium]|nr:phosphoserine phosphatase SerB [Mariprofundales bacterium]